MVMKRKEEKRANSSSLEEERKLHERLWRARGGQSLAPALALLQREWRSPEELQQDVAQRTKKMVAFAVQNVPYYANLFQHRGLDLRAFVGNERQGLAELLQQIPPLDKATLQREKRKLWAIDPPNRRRAVGMRRTSGTTGQPTEVLQSARSMAIFRWLKLRELRWFRVDPRKRMMAIRPSIELPGSDDPSEHQELVKKERWPLVGALVETGPFVGLANTHPVARQRAILGQQKPGFLLMQAAGLEHLALSCAGQQHAGRGLEACQSISQTLSAPMRATAERHFGVAIHENYGLNEFGLVASRCPVSGHFHVHSELCHFEVVDEQGFAVAAGEWGRLLLTTLVNDAMPLIRYDTGDKVMAVSKPCPCGRGLASFGAIRGRYRRLSNLPTGTWERWAAIQYALYELPAELTPAIERYQAKQFRLGDWELRLQLGRDALSAIAPRVRERFDRIAGEAALRVVRTRDFEEARGRKFQNFLSEWMADEGVSAEAVPSRTRADGESQP